MTYNQKSETMCIVPYTVCTITILPLINGKSVYNITQHFLSPYLCKTKFDNKKVAKNFFKNQNSARNRANKRSLNSQKEEESITEQFKLKNCLKIIRLRMKNHCILERQSVLFKCKQDRTYISINDIRRSIFPKSNLGGIVGTSP